MQLLVWEAMWRHLFGNMMLNSMYVIQYCPVVRVNSSVFYRLWIFLCCMFYIIFVIVSMMPKTISLPYFLQVDLVRGQIWAWLYTLD